MGSTGVTGFDEDREGIKDSPFRGEHPGSSTDTQRLADSGQEQGRSIGGRSALWARHRQLHGGQMVPRQGTAPPGPMKTVIQSVVQVVVENGQSSIGAFVLPTVPTVVDFPSYGPLTVPAGPAYPSAPPQTLPTVPAYPFATTAATPASSAAISASSSAAISSTGNAAIPASSNTATSASSNTATLAPAIVPELSSALQNSNSSRTSLSSSQTLQSSSLSKIRPNHSSVQLPVVKTSSAFPSITAVGNFSIISEFIAHGACISH